MFWRKKGYEKVSTNDDDDDGPAAGHRKPNLDYIIGASLADDLGVNSAIFERIAWLYRSWRGGRNNDRPLGRNKDIRTIQVACQKTEPERRMPALSSNG